MATTYGLTAAGFVLKPQAQIITEIQSALQQVFGQNINLAPNSNFGNLVGIFSEREALLWELGQAVYASQYPGGAEGTSVDNILALNNLRRIGALATKTNSIPVTQSNGITLYGLLLFGTPGTVIQSGSIIQTNATPPLQFTTNATVTIGAAVNAQQSVFFSNTPTMGSFSLQIVDVSGNALTTPLIAWNALPTVTQLGFSAVPVTGAFKLSFAIAGATLTTASIPYTATASQVQAAITALSGLSGVTVSGSFSAGFLITWGSVPNPITTVSTNTLGVTTTVVDSMQSAINSLLDSSTGKYPYTDVVVTVPAAGYNFTFGAGSPSSGQPSSAATAQALMTVASNTLQMGASVTNILVVNEAQGAPAQAIAAATCTQTGANFVAAGALNTIGSSVSGWTGVVNQLDCVTGSAAENDTQALARRQTDLQAQANGPLQAIIEKVRAVTNVVTAIGFENNNDAAVQVLSFASAPSTGSFVLALNGNLTSALPYNCTASQIQTAIRAVSGYGNTLVTGSIAANFSIDFNGSFGGQPQPLTQVTSNTTGVTITPTFGRPGHSIEIVALGGADLDVATAILNSKPGGIQTYGTTTVPVTDSLGTVRLISFSRPTEVPIYVGITLITDIYNIPGDSGSGLNPNSLFNVQSVNTIQQDIVTIGNEVSIGGLVVGFGTNGLIGAFNSVPGIVSYTLYFGRSPSPVSNSNIQMQPEETPVFETFNCAVSYT